VERRSCSKPLQIKMSKNNQACTQHICIAQSAGKFIAFAHGELARRPLKSSRKFAQRSS
jgi:hypothetical protein